MKMQEKKVIQQKHPEDNIYSKVFLCPNKD